jgi:hypothetical protein
MEDQAGIEGTAPMGLGVLAGLVVPTMAVRVVRPLGTVLVVGAVRAVEALVVMAATLLQVAVELGPPRGVLEELT